ncbi:hypothetical protein EX30DRAFT_359766 [Ascodesmis nigricans]|uniref:RING-type E3 ubiquitin transferase n=1 Tax=Ascodesmis nigricans TaxID=341454 RepID=A0A4S2MS85_9PEZI|nr:hypothetical protein EX30DRAFT_359766 [Ascodesmis nigricans]
MFVNLLSSLIQNIVGDQHIPRSPGLGAQRDGHDQRPGRDSPGEAGREEHDPEHRSPEGEQRPSIFGPRLAPRDANSPQATPGEPHVIDLPTFLLSLFPNVAPGGAEAGAPPQLGPAFFSQFFPRGPTGDYVYSQRELDEIITRLMEQHQGNAPPPAPKEAIDKLPRVKVTEAQAVEGIDCAVCKDELNVGEEVCQLPCKHVYHFDCVKTWLEAHNTCPICRSPITENTAESNRDHHQQQQGRTSSPSPTSPHPHPPSSWVSGAPQPQPGSPHAEHGNPTWSRSWSASWAFGGNNDPFRQTPNQRQDQHGDDNNSSGGGGGNNQSSGRTFANLFRRGGSH